LRSVGSSSRPTADAAQGVELPERPDLRIDAPPYEDVLRIVEATKGHPKYLPLIIGARTGMRRGEILGLRWCDVDIEKREIRVRQTASYEGEEVILSENVKTKRARRQFPMPDDLAEVPDAAKTEQATRLGIGAATRLVVDDGDGQPVHPERLTRYFARHCHRLGVEMRLHDLRRSYASELLSKGVNVLKVSEILGHATPDFTLRVYGHVMPRDDGQARAALALPAVMMAVNPS
jgi:integrase